MKLMSPNQLHEAAKSMYLNGREPSSWEDWSLVVNFWAFNIATAEVEACTLLAKIYDCPLPEDYVTAIAQHQINVKAEGGRDA